MRHLPTIAGQMVDDVAALEVIDEIVEVHVKPELTHPLVMPAPPLVGENGCVRDEFACQSATGST